MNRTTFGNNGMSSLAKADPATETGDSPSFRAAMGASNDATAGSRNWAIQGRPYPDSPIQTFEIASDRFTVGRCQTNDIHLSNDTVSSCHAELLLIDTDLYVRDLNSTNGTLLNGRKVTALSCLREGDILHFGNAMYTIQKSQTSSRHSTLVTDAEGSAIAQVMFGRLISVPAVVPYLQPIVQLADSLNVGYEALARSQLVGLETPDKMFHVAAQHSAEVELSHVCRQEGLRTAGILANDVPCYVNTHPAELGTHELFDSLVQLRNEFPDQKITVEVHESGITSTAYLKSLRQLLDRLHMGLAYDDFGAGQARLMELMDAPPDVLKFDINLIRGLSVASPKRRAATASLIQMVRGLGVVTLAEGVESVEEAEICHECGFELAQGYLFGKPQPSSFWLDQRVVPMSTGS